MDGIWNPLRRYQGDLAETHRRNTAAFFEELVSQSGVDEEANASLVKEIRALEAALSENGDSLGGLTAFRVFLWIVVAAALVLPWFGPEAYQEYWGAVLGGCVGGGILAFILILCWLNPRILAIREECARLEAERQRKRAEAEEQMAPLNALYTWGMVARLIEKTVPDFSFETFCTRELCEDLADNYDLNLDLGEDSSVISCQSGYFHKNPFILARTLNTSMGTEVYTGTLVISWRERESYTDSDGRRRTRWVTRSQTLVASVKKPKPVYHEDCFLLYGHEAAPKLTFTRKPTGLDADDEDWWSRHRLSSKIKTLKNKSRELNGFTMMANENFEAVFQALDRSDEQQFRLLFTPLAQQAMTELVSEDVVSYGDDFNFIKAGKINVIRSRFMDKLGVVAPPSSFHNIDLEEARKNFNEFSNEYFRLFFFAFAPLLTIPRYQDDRSLAVTSAAEMVFGKAPPASSWEFESLANYHGEEKFKAPHSVTRNILKVTRNARTGARVLVTAYGYDAVKQVDYVSVYGGDGRWHNVPVPWLEYIPVRNDTEMAVEELNQDGKPRDLASCARALLRRGILSGFAAEL